MADNVQSLAASCKKTVLAGLWYQIPVLRLMLGLCPTLAVTTGVKASLTMGCSVIFVLVCSNLMVSLIRNLLKPHLRILMFTLTISTFVTIADLFLRAFMPDMSERLGAYVPLIIVNCIIICRSEECASKNGLIISILDGLAMGVGFTAVLCLVGSIREVLSMGAFFGYRLMPSAFVPWAAMAMPVGAFVTLGLLLGLANHLGRQKS